MAEPYQAIQLHFSPPASTTEHRRLPPIRKGARASKLSKSYLLCSIAAETQYRHTVLTSVAFPGEHALSTLLIMGAVPHLNRLTSSAL